MSFTRACRRAADGGNPPGWEAYLRNPAAFYFSGYTTNNGDWTVPQNNALWRDESQTLFDPCPAGWRVPPGGEGIRSVWSAVTTDNGVWNGANGQPEGGYYYNGISNQGSPWYPASGFYMPVGDFSGAGYWIHNWNSTTNNDRAYCFRISQTDFTPNALNVRNHGFPVRCVRQ